MPTKELLQTLLTVSRSEVAQSTSEDVVQEERGSWWSSWSTVVQTVRDTVAMNQFINTQDHTH